jgi:hypothetical protein
MALLRLRCQYDQAVEPDEDEKEERSNHALCHIIDKGLHEEEWHKPPAVHTFHRALWRLVITDPSKAKVKGSELAPWFAHFVDVHDNTSTQM